MYHPAALNSHRLSQNVADHLGLVHTGETFLEPIAIETQLFKIQTEQMQNRGMKIGDADTILHRRVPKLVRGTVDMPRLDAATR